MSDDFNITELVNERWHRFGGVILNVVLAALGFILVVNITKLLIIIY